MYFFTVIFLLFFSFLFPSMAKAQLFLEEGKVALAVTAGERINKSMTVSNTSDKEVHFKVYWEDFQYQAPYDGSKKFFPAGVGPFSASQWINYSPQEVTLPAYGKQKIDYSINVPSSIEGGYYGVLFFEQIGAALKSSTGLDVVTRVGALFFIEPKGISRNASLENIVIKGPNVSGEFVNKAKVTLIPRMVYYIMEEGGMVKNRGELKKIYVPAGATASWEMPVPTDLNPGRYSIVMNMDLEEQNVVTKEIYLVKDSSGQVVIEKSQD